MANGTFVIENVGIADAGADAISGTGNTSVTITDSTITASAATGFRSSMARCRVSGLQPCRQYDHRYARRGDFACHLRQRQRQHRRQCHRHWKHVGGTLTAGSGSATGDGIDLTGNAATPGSIPTFSTTPSTDRGGIRDRRRRLRRATLQLPLTANYVYTDATSQGNASRSAPAQAPATLAPCASTRPTTRRRRRLGNAWRSRSPTRAAPSASRDT